MEAIIVDYVGVLDGMEEDQRRWRTLFAALKRAKIRTAVLSNDPGGPNAEPIREWEYRGIVDAVLLSGEIGVEKPNIGAFQAAADALGVDRTHCVLIDDSIVNIRAAVEAGLIGVYYQQFDRAVVEIQQLFGIEGEF